MDSQVLMVIDRQIIFHLLPLKGSKLSVNYSIQQVLSACQMSSSCTCDDPPSVQTVAKILHSQDQVFDVMQPGEKTEDFTNKIQG